MNDDKHNYCTLCGQQLHEDQANGETCDTCRGEAKRGSIKVGGLVIGTISEWRPSKTRVLTDVVEVGTPLAPCDYLPGRLVMFARETVSRDTVTRNDLSEIDDDTAAQYDDYAAGLEDDHE